MPTVAELLQSAAQSHPEARAFVFFDEDETPVSYAELDAAARRIAAAVASAGGTGNPVLLLYPPGRAYVEGFLGCLYAGSIAVPAYPPDVHRLEQALDRLRRLIADCDARLALTVSDLAPMVPSVAPGLEVLATDAVPSGSWDLPSLADESPALLQYTSGSTGAPKGVVLSHANLLHNAGLVQLGFGSTPESVGVSWLPPYHDMGLIGGVLQPLFARFPTVLMSPLTFLQRPMVWLETISRYGGTMSGAPNFAYDLCVRKSTESERSRLDLSAWRVAFCGAEPVRASTLERFASAFAVAGFRREAFYPCYGLAEATLIVTGGRTRVVGDRVGSGRVLGDQRVAVVDPSSGSACVDGVEGEIWVSGPSVASGYHGKPEESARVFGARLEGRRWLRTGDLGFLDPSGELVVTGRVKDLIIIRGRNVYPQDLEHLVESSVAEVRPGCSAAFATEVDGEERLVFACEVTSSGPSVVAAIRQVLAESAQIVPAAIVLLAPRQIPKTSSGKIQRQACRDAYHTNTWPVGTAISTPEEEESVADGSGDEDAQPTGSLSLPASSSGDEGAHPAGSPSPVPSTPADEGALPTDELTATPAAVRIPSGDQRAQQVGRVAKVVAATLGMAVPIDEPLTRYGLDSLHAVELRAALNTQLGIEVAFSELLSGITVQELATRSATMTEPTPAQERPPVAERGGKGMRERGPVIAGGGGGEVGVGVRALWFVQRWAPESTAYHINRAARIRSAVDVDALRRAFETLVDRHTALRVSLPVRDGEPYARETTPEGLVRHDVADLTEPELRRRIQADSERPFDMENGPLFRAILYTRAPDDHVLLLSLHHVITDFWSLSVMVDELLAFYGGESESSAAPAWLPATQHDVERRLEYWRRTLDGAPASLELASALPRPKLQSFRGASERFRWSAETRERLDAFADQTNATRFVVVLAAYATLLARHGGGEEVVVGTPTAGRDDPSSTRAVGYFVNPVPLRIRVEPHGTFRELVNQVRETVLNALDNAVPFPQLVEAVRPERDPGRAPVLQTMLALQQAPPGRSDLAAFAVSDEAASTRLGDLDITPYPLGERGSAFDLSVVLAEVGDGLSGLVEYCPDVIDPELAGHLGVQLERLLKQALARPDDSAESFDLTGTEERETVLAMADGGPALSEGSTLPELFAEQVKRRPQATAVVFGDQELTYAELDERSDRLAARLQERGVRRGDPVGVSIDRSPDLIIAFWGVLKSGGGYLPLEVSLPKARTGFMVKDAAPRVVLTETDAPEATRTPADLTPEDLAYILYTSGSTGQPKGVVVPHRGGGNLAASFAVALGLTEDDRVLQYSSCAFDISVMEILIAHLNGAALHLIPSSAVIPGPELAELIASQRITAAVLTPSTLTALPAERLPDLTKLVSGGEALPPDLLARWSAGRRLLNGYGPTEVTVAATWAECDPDDPRRPPIGKPMPGVRTYVLDARGEPVAVGMPGELYVGGIGVAHGYLNRPGLTAEHFVPDPFAGSGKMYRTGDRVLWRPDGQIDFLGRVDEQVKIRGARVEPGEVAARLRDLLGLTELAVVPRPGPGGATELAAYLVTNGERRTAGELRDLLRAELPESYLPASFVYLDALPRNNSGKVDVRALPAPSVADRGGTRGRAPRTRTEHLVARVWSDVLGVEPIGMDDHFFDQLGGHSLLVAKVTSALSGELGQDVPVTHLFEHPTVAALARRLDGEQNPPGNQAIEQAAARRRALSRRRTG